jgi:hypothetical protein
MKKIKLLLVCGSWSSGTTAVSGMLHAMEIPSVPPYFTTRDERTKVTYESILFRDTLRALINEEGLKVTADRKKIMEALQIFKLKLEEHFKDHQEETVQLFMKDPLAAFILPEICSAFQTQLIYVLRPLKDIEQTRKRRMWFYHLGEKGATVIYSKLFSVMLNYSIPTLIIKYPELIKMPKIIAGALAKFCNIKDAAKIESAASFVINHKKV